MENNRRDFIKKSAALAALSVTGAGAVASVAKQTNETPVTRNLVKDAGMHLCEAYFDGPEARKVTLNKQLGVLGAVGRMSPNTFGSDLKPWDLNGIQAVKEGWEKLGLTMRVIEGDMVMGNKIKLGLPGRDEEIANFITLVQNIGKAGINIICYNWMPVSCCERYNTTGRG
ncbi:MAG: mannonate dehydratase, partial [Mucilaginibacter sp.]